MGSELREEALFRRGVMERERKDRKGKERKGKKGSVRMGEELAGVP